LLGGSGFVIIKLLIFGISIGLAVQVFMLVLPVVRIVVVRLFRLQLHRPLPALPLLPAVVPLVLLLAVALPPPLPVFWVVMGFV